jgi:hypothetical protein
MVYSIQLMLVMGQGFSFQADIAYQFECHKNITNPTLNCHGDIEYFYIFPLNQYINRTLAGCVKAFLASKLSVAGQKLVENQGFSLSLLSIKN